MRSGASKASSTEQSNEWAVWVNKGKDERMAQYWVRLFLDHSTNCATTQRYFSQQWNATTWPPHEKHWNICFLEHFEFHFGIDSGKTFNQHHIVIMPIQRVIQKRGNFAWFYLIFFLLWPPLRLSLRFFELEKVSRKINFQKIPRFGYGRIIW